MRYSNLLLLPALFFAPLAFAADTTPLTTENDKLSYSIGVNIGQSFVNQDIQVNPQQFSRGLTDALSKNKTLLSTQEMQDVVNRFQEQQIAKVTERDNKLAAENLVKANKFLAENKKKPNVKTLKSGLQYTEVSSGKGTPPKIGDTITVNYRGTLIDGTEFDSSYRRNESSTIVLENLIPAWLEALPMMTPGSKWKIYVPPQLAYENKRAGQIIEPNSALIFDIELVSVKPKA